MCYCLVGKQNKYKKSLLYSYFTFSYKELVWLSILAFPMQHFSLYISQSVVITGGIGYRKFLLPFKKASIAMTKMLTLKCLEEKLGQNISIPGCSKGVHCAPIVQNFGS